ncbi:heme lyase CcmF/NrfE family subunit [Sphingosinicella microcystinivorans]|uniref:Cytochrome c-type biogenesis protein CcmF n=1 Tax=Sphingosinicella microcystinivorans TaxID=335406 RepID=A0ABX9SYC1_SPHMI|nr:heme lyase CcmF/NrfE family subunit [Sphingosinicella microcystinivorans]RKS88828.1 cytochrome c-type biogenesis protein CcmF [Sphingosinicella microcystinivorans]
MIPEIGHAALWLAAGLALAQALAGFRADGGRIAVPAALLQGLLCAVAFAALTWAFVKSDFSVALVAGNSHTAKPELYKWTGVWANHEGSMLLWVAVLAVFGAIAAIRAKGLGERFRTVMLSAQGFIALGFYAYLLIASNPFARIVPAPIEGSGMNPLLQDPGLAFHPPLLYIGYVGLSVTFSFAVAALLLNRVTPEWARAVKPWVLGAWSFLTAGITLGSFWAYYELGWGGWWFWDPVENASLMPWLAATALFHSVGVLAARGALKNWTLLLAVVAFSLSMVGTFIVRSGLLTSVHAFAVDPERGVFLLILLAIYVGGALTLYALRAGTVTAGAPFRPVSREGSLVVNNLILSAVLGVVFLGTLYPLLLEAATGEQVSVGPPYFQTALLPLLLPLVALMAAGPLMRWQAMDWAGLGRRLVPALVLGVAAIGIALALGMRSPLALAGVALSAWLTAASVMIFRGRKLKRIRRIPASVWGTALAHLGIAVTTLGIAVSGAGTIETLANLAPGGRLSAGPYTAQVDDITPAAGPNYTAIRAVISVSGPGATTVLMPERRTFVNPGNETTETDIWPRLTGNLYAVLGPGDGSGRWQVRLVWQPMIALIWIGGMMAAFGGLISMKQGRRRREDTE